MARERPTFWNCDHHATPIEVVSTEGGGRRARCLGCGACGPVVRSGSEEAMLALRAEAGYRGKRGA